MLTNGESCDDNCGKNCGEKFLGKLRQKFTAVSIKIAAKNCGKNWIETEKFRSPFVSIDFSLRRGCAQ